MIPQIPAARRMRSLSRYERLGKPTLLQCDSRDAAMARVMRDAKKLRTARGARESLTARAELCRGECVCRGWCKCVRRGRGEGAEEEAGEMRGSSLVSSSVWEGSGEGTYTMMKVCVCGCECIGRRRRKRSRVEAEGKLEGSTKHRRHRFEVHPRVTLSSGWASCVETQHRTYSLLYGSRGKVAKVEVGATRSVDRVKKGGRKSENECLTLSYSSNDDQPLYCTLESREQQFGPSVAGVLSSRGANEEMSFSRRCKA